MSVRTRRHVALLELGHPLRRYANARLADPNAPSLLVQLAMSAAFSEPRRIAAGATLESSLREDIHRSFCREQPEPGPEEALADGPWTLKADDACA
jgi:hypothetical protein